MKTTLILVGKTRDKLYTHAIDDYRDRIGHYMPFEIVTIPELRATASLSEAQQKEKEGELILQKVQPADTLVLLDEHGREPRSVELAAWLDHGAPPRLRHRRALRLLPGGLCARQRADLALAPHVLPPDGAPRLRGATLSRVYDHKRGEVSPRVVAVGVLFPFFLFFFLLSFLILFFSLTFSSFPLLSFSFLLPFPLLPLKTH